MSKKGKRNINGGLILMIILIIIVVLSGGFLLLYPLLNNYKNIISDKKNNISDFISNSYNLVDNSYKFKEDNTNIIDSYTSYEDDDFKLSINKDKRLVIRNKKNRNNEVVEEIKDVKTFLIDRETDYNLVLTEDGEIFTFDYKLEDYLTYEDGVGFQRKFRTANQYHDGVYNFESEDPNDPNASNVTMKFKKIFKIKKYTPSYNYNGDFSGNINIEYEFIALSDDKKYYVFESQGFDDTKGFKSLDDLMEQYNKNAIGVIADENFAYILDKDGELNLMKEGREFLSNKFTFKDNNKSKVYKMFVYYNNQQYSLYVLTIDNKLYSATVSEYLSISSVIEFEEIKQDKKVISISYKLPKKYSEYIKDNKDVNISDLTFIYDDNTKFIIDDINYTDVFNILESE